MREHLFELATLPPTRRQALSRLARDASVIAQEARVAVALLPQPCLPAARAAGQRTRPLRTRNAAQRRGRCGAQRAL
ncbi:hypothetical protein GGR77_001482 [Xanthomonas translucens]